MDVEEEIRMEVADELGRELSDDDWRRVYEQAKRKLRHIIDREGDADGARTSVWYIAQLVVEAVRAEALAAWTKLDAEAKRKGADANADPQGHTTTLSPISGFCQELFA